MRRYESSIKSKSYLSVTLLKVRIKQLVQRMVKAYILIKATVGKEENVLREVLGLSVTEEAHKVFGPYDIVAEVRGRDMETLIEIITEKVRKIDGIEDTQSILVIDSEIDLSSTNFMT